MHAPRCLTPHSISSHDTHRKPRQHNTPHHITTQCVALHYMHALHIFILARMRHTFQACTHNRATCIHPCIQCIHTRTHTLHTSHATHTRITFIALHHIALYYGMLRYLASHYITPRHITIHHIKLLSCIHRMHILHACMRCMHICTHTYTCI